MIKSKITAIAALCSLLTLGAAYADEVKDWTGFYSGSQVVTTDAKNFSEDAKGVYLGYRQDMGQYVIGAEVGYLNYNNGIDRQDAKVQVGYDSGNFLPYATVGSVKINSVDGYTYGLGFDYKTDQNVLYGAEYLKSDVFDDTVIVKVGYQF